MVCVQAMTAAEDVQRLQAEASSLRRALQDAELEMQHMTVAHQSEMQQLLKVLLSSALILQAGSA